MENFKHYIGINQRAIVELGLDLDFTDVAIFEYIKSFANSPKCVKVNTDDGIFFWVSHKNIMDEMPMLRIKTSQGIINRVEKLIDAGLLAKYKDCEKFGKTLYTFGPNYDLYEGFYTPKENLRVPSTKVEGNNNINNNINTPSISNDISPKGEDVDDGFDEFWEKYDKKVQRAQAERMWRKLNKSQKQEVLDSVEAYVASTPDKQYRLNPASYLNPKNKRWQDELRTGGPSLFDNGKSFEERRDAFYDKINALIPNYSNEYGREGAKRLLYAFYLRWAEKTQDGLYMRWEIEKTFEFDKRLAMFIQDNGWKYKH